MKKILLLFLFALAVVAYAGGAKWDYRSFDVNLSVVTTGDAARVTMIKNPLAIDSFVYIDSFSYQADTSVHQTISWTSPVQVMYITPTVDTASAYACSVAFAAQTLGIAFDASGTEPVLDSLIDSLVAQLNAKAGLTDSVDFQDSVSYIKAVSLFGQKKFTARWSTVLVVTGGTGTLDTASSITTVAMVTDSMVAAINADAGLDSFMTATNSGDTGRVVTSDDPGVLFFDTTLNTNDTGGVFVQVTANATSWCSTQDTLWIDKFVDPNNSYNSLLTRFIIQPSYITTQGIGGLDSGYLWLYSGIDFNYTLLAVDTQASLPCTLYYAKPSAAGTDTLFKENLFLVYRIADSASDTTATVPYKINGYYMMKDN